MQIMKEVSDNKCTLERLENVVHFMQTTEIWKSTSEIDLPRIALENLNNISNPSFFGLLMEIMKLLASHLITNESLFNAMVTFLNRTNITASTSIYIEILILCAENGVQPNDRDLIRMEKWTKPISVNEVFIGPFLKFIASVQKCKRFSFSLDFLADCYCISKQVLQYGREVVRWLHGTLEKCLQSAKLIDCFLFIESIQKDEFVFNNNFLKNSVPNNWLERYALHLAVIFSDDDTILQCFSKEIIAKEIHRKDIHGCTALHVAYLHQNESAVQFLLSHSAQLDAVDNFGVMPNGKYVARRDEWNAELNCQGNSSNCEDYGTYDQTEHDLICRGIIDASSGVLEKLKPIVVLPQDETQVLCDDLTTLFSRLLKETKFSDAEVFIAGSLREKFKVGCLDEADVQLRFKSPMHEEEDLKYELQENLISSMTKIDWEGIFLRPVCVKVPWKFIREGASVYRGLTLSVDLVPVIVHSKVLSTPIDSKAEEEHKHKLPHILVDAPKRIKMTYIVVNTWLGKPRHFHQSQYAFEWDIIDSLPKSYRLAIFIAKGLVHAYDNCKEDKHVGMPISSYNLKTAIFYLALRDFHSYQAALASYELSGTDRNDIKRMTKDLETALLIAKYHRESSETLVDGLTFDPNPEWTTEKDLELYGEEARIVTRKIFIFIGTLAKLGYKLVRYWNYRDPIKKLMGLGEADYICTICERLLEKLEKSHFYKDL